MDTLPRHVYDELREEFNMWYTEWREDNPDGDIIDWIVKLPKWMGYWATYERYFGSPYARRGELYTGDYDTNSTWRAWLDFCNWFTEQNRLVAEAAQKGDKADE